jgi:hypothetical protein
MWRKFLTCHLPSATYKVAHHKMKGLFRIFELSRNEQRVVLIVMLALIVLAFVGYERRVNRSQVRLTPATELKPSPSPVESEDER